MSVVVLGTLTASAATGVKADDPVSSSVRFNREIIRILQRRCLSCHVEGSLAMPLVSYRDVREWSRAIREEVVEQRMPPSTAAPGYGRFENVLGLTSRETTTLLSWLDGGMPRGDERDLPSLDIGGAGAPSPSAAAGARIELPAQNIPALDDLVIRRVVVDTGLTVGRLVSRVVVRPGSRSVLRGALVYTGVGEQSWVGAWVPWQHTFVAPAAHAFMLAKGAPLTVVLYYRGGDTPTVDRSTVELHFAVEPARPLDSLRIETAVGQSSTSAANGAGRLVLSASTTIWALQPSPDVTTQSLELRADRPDGSIEVLLWMPTVRPEWPSVLVLQQPVSLPAGTVLSLTTRRASARSAPDRVILSAWHDGR